jgi:hypothetical protein
MKRLFLLYTPRHHLPNTPLAFIAIPVLSLQLVKITKNGRKLGMMPPLIFQSKRITG